MKSSGSVHKRSSAGSVKEKVGCYCDDIHSLYIETNFKVTIIIVHCRLSQSLP